LLCSDVLHPNRANVSKDELRGKLGELYKAKKDDVSVFGLKTHFGGGKSTGFALIYDSAEAMKKFEPRYRLVRYGMATKVEKASRQQRTLHSITHTLSWIWHRFWRCDDGHMLTMEQASSARTG
jgi:ribosomal protein S24E